MNALRLILRLLGVTIEEIDRAEHERAMARRCMERERAQAERLAHSMVECPRHAGLWAQARPEGEQ